jgi:hypothetical protein
MQTAYNITCGRVSLLRHCVFPFDLREWRLKTKESTSRPEIGDGIVASHKICYAAQKLPRIMMDTSSTTLSWIGLGSGVLALIAAIWFAAELGRAAGGAENTVRLATAILLFGISLLASAGTNLVTKNAD